MPSQTGALLTPEERAAFGAWLAACVERSSVSKKALAHALGDDTSTQRFNRYLRGLVPTLPVLAKIATTLAIPPLVALWRAGYFREFLVRIDARSKDASPFHLHITIGFALMVFPRRDVGVLSLFDRGPAQIGNTEYFLYFFAVPDIDFGIAFEPLGSDLPLHPLLRHAADALALRGVPLETRRFAAAEYVNAWADLINFDGAAVWRSVFAKSDQLPTPCTAEQIYQLFFHGELAPFSPTENPHHEH